MRAARVLPGVVTTFVVAIAFAVPAQALTTTDPLAGRQWNLDKVGAETAWKIATGSGITIAIVDSGVDLSHEDLAAHVVAGTDIVGEDASAADENGHGSHVAGIAAAVTNNGRGVAGVAPDARIMPVRVLDQDGSGFDDDVLAGVKWAVDHGANVINLSLGVTGAQVLGSKLGEAVRYAWDRGAIAVVAAGNDYVLSSGFGDEPAVVVSATTDRDEKPDYSNGVGAAKWGLAAPGGGGTLTRSGPDIVSTYWDGKGPNRYAETSGTSMAAPHVSGALAILLSAGLTPQQAIDRLMSTAVDLGTAGPDRTFGHGRIDLAAAVKGLTPVAAPPVTTAAPVTGSSNRPARPTRSSTTAPGGGSGGVLGTQTTPTTTDPGGSVTGGGDAPEKTSPTTAGRSDDGSGDSASAILTHTDEGPPGGLVAVAAILWGMTAAAAVALARRQRDLT